MDSSNNISRILNPIPPLGLLSITAYRKERGNDVDSVKITEGRGERPKDYHVGVCKE
jgi:hypothetical protein